MIYERDLDEAIAVCQGERNPTANTCIKLAAFYTLKNELYGRRVSKSSYSYAPGPVETVGHTIEYKSDTDFGRTVDGMDMKKVMGIVDELMTTLQAVYPKLYDAVMGKLHG